MAIRARVDEAAGRVTLTHPRREAITVDPDDAGDAARLVAWVTPLADPGRARPAFVVRARRGMTDSDFPSISLLNRASLAALGDRLGRPLAMERFRGNVWLEGLAPLAEFDLVGREVRVGGALLAGARADREVQGDAVDPGDRGQRCGYARRVAGGLGTPGLRGLRRGGRAAAASRSAMPRSAA